MKKNKGIFIKSFENHDFILNKDASGKGKHILCYYFINPKTGINERVRTSKGIVGIKGEKELLRRAGFLADAIINFIKKPGFNPFEKNFSVHTISPSSTILECTSDWLKHRQKKFDNDALSKSRLIASQIIIKHFNSWLLAERYQYRKPGTFNEIDITDFLETKSKKEKWSKSTYNSYRDNIKTFFIYLLKSKVIEENPVSGVESKNIKNDTSIYKVFELEELSTVRKLLNGSPNYFNLLVASKLLYKFGIRLEEQLKLQIKQYDPDKRKLIIPPGGGTKNLDEATFTFDDEMHDLVMALIKDYPADFYFYGDRSKPGIERLAYGYFGQKWRKFRKLHNISDKLKIYALKHSSAYYAVESGVNLNVVADWARHSDDTVTRRYSNGSKKKIITSTNTNHF